MKRALLIESGTTPENYKYRIVLVNTHLCGYVEVPSLEMAEQLFNENHNIDVHGSITFWGIWDNVPYVGFDTAHLMDKPATHEQIDELCSISPENSDVIEDFLKAIQLALDIAYEVASWNNKSTFKDLDYVRQECFSLSKQLDNHFNY